MKRIRTTVRRRLQPGFTLLELLLVVVIVLLLTGAMVFNFSNLLRGHELEEGTTRLETLMRFARAQAANSGRKVQLVFGSENTNTPAASTGEVRAAGEVRATWEPDPLRQPGCFSDLAEAQWHLQELNDLVQVESVKLLESDGTSPASVPGEEEAMDNPPGKNMGPITFYPDGSSDSAEIIVAARSTEEEQRMAVRLIGMTGTISHQVMTASIESDFADPIRLERSRTIRRDGPLRDYVTDPELGGRKQDPRPAPTPPRANPMDIKTPVGETSSLDQGQ